MHPHCEIGYETKIMNQVESVSFIFFPFSDIGDGETLIGMLDVRLAKHGTQLEFPIDVPR